MARPLFFNDNEQKRAQRELNRLRSGDQEKIEELLAEAGKISQAEKTRRDQLRNKVKQKVK